MRVLLRTHRYSRLITCKTYLKRLNITQPMAEHLLPLHDLTLPSKRRRSSNDGAGSDGDEDAPKRGTYEQMFKEQIVIVDEAGATFRVQYEGVTCNAQKHLRLTCGWRDFIKQHNVEIGECRRAQVYCSGAVLCWCVLGWAACCAGLLSPACLLSCA